MPSMVPIIAWAAMRKGLLTRGCPGRSSPATTATIMVATNHAPGIDSFRAAKPRPMAAMPTIAHHKSFGFTRVSVQLTSPINPSSVGGGEKGNEKNTITEHSAMRFEEMINVDKKPLTAYIIIGRENSRIKMENKCFRKT